MNSWSTAFLETFRSELLQLKRSPLLIVLTVIQAITFIFLVNFFGMTGAFAPTALIDNDKGPYAKTFIQNLKDAHHSFTLLSMDEKTAQEKIKQGKLVAIITIPKGFSKGIEEGKTIPLNVVVDNIDTDMTADIQRALPAAITRFAQKLHLSGIHVTTAERDLIDHDTGFIPYLVTSALALSAFIIAGILGGVTIAREFESKTHELVTLSPTHPMIPLLGRIFATSIVASITMLLALGIVIFGHGIIPIYPWELTMALFFCIVVFGLVGAAFGVVLKKTFPVASFIFGISLPLYLFSGTYEPERFDGNTIWILAHFTPLYYAVGILEHAMLNLQVTPESVLFNFFALLGWGLLSLFITWFYIRKDDR